MQFRCAHDAVCFGFNNQNRENVKVSDLRRISGAGDLTLGEIIWQAVGIVGKVDRLPHAERSAIHVKCNPFVTYETVRSLADLIGLPPRIESYACVRAYKDDKPSIREIALESGKAVGTIQEMRKKAFDKIDAHYFRGMALLECALGDLIERAA